MMLLYVCLIFKLVLACAIIDTSGNSKYAQEFYLRLTEANIKFRFNLYINIQFIIY